MSNGKEEEYVLNPEYLKPTLSNFEANFKTIIEDANNNSSNEYCEPHFSRSRVSNES